VTAGSLRKPVNLILISLLVVAIARLWIAPIRSSFWVDEMVTVFVVHHGAADPSLSVAPQVSKSIYYSVARAADAIFGISEDGYRLPSILFAALALLLVARLASRLIDPRAAWFAVFACLAIRSFNQESSDARPYAMGFCVVAASFLFLVRWLDSGKWLDAAGFIILAALVWRVHLLFWPIYITYLIYTAVRIVRAETTVDWQHALGVFALIGVALLPLVSEVFSLYREAHRHVIVEAPTNRQLTEALHWKLLLQCGGAALLLALALRWKNSATFPWAAASLIGGWWLIHPVCLFAFSWITGNSVFVPRYLSPEIPGAALAVTLLVSRFIPAPQWNRVSVIFAAAVCLVMGQWGRLPAANSDWRDAAMAVNQLGSTTPVICPSPFVEAQSPVWRPDYPLPGFLYAHLPVYPVQGREFLFPFKDSPEAEQYATSLCKDVFPSTGRFAIYGGQGNVRFWREWFDQRPELSGWVDKRLGPFGDVDVVLFERPQNFTKR
jgi:hypothetical protein